MRGNAECWKLKKQCKTAKTMERYKCQNCSRGEEERNLMNVKILKVQVVWMCYLKLNFPFMWKEAKKNGETAQILYEEENYLKTHCKGPHCLVWERQIRTIRNVLNATLTQSAGRLDDASLRTLFYEATAIVNSRPLSTDGINDPNSLEPLTPNHLILMKSKLALPPPGKFVAEDVYGTKRWRRVQYLIEQFWSQWKREYLSNISIRQKWHVPRRNLQVNDVVIIKEEILPRNQWQLARVVETTVDSDGLVRRVKVQVGAQRSLKTNSPSKPSIIERPIQKLVLLLESEYLKKSAHTYIT